MKYHDNNGKIEYLAINNSKTSFRVDTIIMIIRERYNFFYIEWSLRFSHIIVFVNSFLFIKISVTIHHFISTHIHYNKDFGYMQINLFIMSHYLNWMSNIESVVFGRIPMKITQSFADTFRCFSCIES